MTGAGTPLDATVDRFRRVVAGRRAMISGGAVRRARTGAGRACDGAGAAVPPSPAARVAEPGTTGTTRLGAAAPRPSRPGRASVPGRAEADPATAGAGPVAVRLATGPGPDPAGASAPLGAEGATGSSGAPPAARSSNGAPEGAVRGRPGARATPWTSPTGADGSTAWPRSPSL
ncbi:hypothetical protein [Streptomyces sp. NPDC019224]|uniref:hypothetical protein n=1 Tax=Streptomyces sp. NPDC019224 TaxID=3154484 RepID=UPI0033CD9922